MADEILPPELVKEQLNAELERQRKAVEEEQPSTLSAVADPILSTAFDALGEVAMASLRGAASVASATVDVAAAAADVAGSAASAAGEAVVSVVSSVLDS